MNRVLGFLITAGVAAVTVTVMLVVRRRTLRIVDRALEIAGADVRVPCDAEGNAT